MKEIRTYYQYGTEALSPERIRSDPDYHYREERRIRRERQEKIARRREHKRNLRASRLSTFTTCFGVLLVSVALFGFIYLQNQITASKKNISALENEITQIVTLNNATRSRIDSSINLTQIKNTAMGRMGMVYADADHVVYYNTNGTDYMNSYQ